jgi:hypothetical protein
VTFSFLNPRVLSTLILILVFAPVQAAAQTDSDIPETDRIHYSFANYLGAGIYAFHGRTVEIYRFPYTFDFLTTEERRWGLALRIPVTLGIYQLRSDDYIGGDLPDRIATVSLVPRLLFPVRLSPEWVLSPFADLGHAWELEQNQSSWVWGFGFRVDGVYELENYDIRPGFRAVWAHHSDPDIELGDDFGKFETGVEFRFPLGFSIKENQADIGAFGVNYFYMNELEIFRPDVEGPISVTTQWEFGMTFGTRTKLKILGITMPRIGLSYRFGDNISAVRFVLGQAF